MSISMDSLSSMIDNTSSTATNSSSALEKKLGNDYSDATDEELMDACKQFETYFIEQVMKEVEKTLPEPEGQDASMTQLTDYYKDEMIQDLASQVSDNSGKQGLAQTLYEQMKRNYNID